MSDQATPSTDSNKKLLIRSSIVFLVACLLYGGAKGFLEGYYDAKDPAKARAAAKVTGLKGCIATAQQTAAQKGLTSAQVAQYCDCAINKSIDSFTDDEMKVAGHHTKGTLSPVEKEHFAVAVRACNEQLQEGLTTVSPAAVPMAPVVNP